MGAVSLEARRSSEQPRVAVPFLVGTRHQVDDRIGLLIVQNWLR